MKFQITISDIDSTDVFELMRRLDGGIPDQQYVPYSEAQLGEVALPSGGGEPPVDVDPLQATIEKLDGEFRRAATATGADGNKLAPDAYVKLGSDDDVVYTIAALYRTKAVLLDEEGNVRVEAPRDLHTFVDTEGGATASEAAPEEDEAPPRRRRRRADDELSEQLTATREKAKDLIDAYEDGVDILKDILADVLETTGDETLADLKHMRDASDLPSGVGEEALAMIYDEIVKELEAG